MKLVSTDRIEFLRELATEILGVYGLGRTVLAVDGTDAETRAAFADDLAAVFEEREHPVFRASLQNFRHSRAEQERFGPESPERLLRYLYDFSLLRRVLLDPFRLGGSTGFVTRAFDAARDTWIEPTWLTGPPDATLIIDGEYLNRKELRDLWSYSVLVETEADAVRFGAGVADDADLENEHTVADRLYRGQVRPRSRATAVVDLSNPHDPRRLFLDSC
ncbi:uridine kinase [Cryobacterium sinapicolor]|uniref:Uridine kinase n=2 Tax=Microbacteriaceae TaxID=85023 RepID=A0ABY2JEV5_9MICO|nr:uridine kinase [Cryobacterium sp. TMT3-29-2]TFD04308.1 uridine kinase [Cryobacterium sinapicolor]